MFNITEKELRKILVDFHKYQFVNNRVNQTFERYKKHLDKLENKGVAGIKQHHSLKKFTHQTPKGFVRRARH